MQGMDSLQHLGVDLKMVRIPSHSYEQIWNMMIMIKQVTSGKNFGNS